MKVSLNGSIIENEEAAIRAETDGLFYGAGCFETFKSYRGKFLHLDRHLHRLNDAVSYLTGQKAGFFTEEQVRLEITELLKANQLSEDHARIRIQVSLGERGGYSLPDANEPSFITLITSDEVALKAAGPLRLVSVNTTVVPSSCRPTQLKLSNMMHYRQAAIEAKAKGADDALMLTVRDEVAETSIANIFWEKNGTIFTPSATCDILPGITRSILIQMGSESGNRIKEGAFSGSDIEQASQIWICNSLKELVWVSSLNGRPYPTDTPLRHDLLQKFEGYKKEKMA
ncbi:aminotransferase class IV [Rhodohalobacter sp. 8-1]|uniref:aminotransferase class IV n=1 Tax=Rhodohalobacter sp. 8-1 TaxID=3131972 RepID=UPI0030EC5CFF